MILFRLVNKCMSSHLNVNVSLDSNANKNANDIFQERIQMQCFGVAFKYKCFCYTFANAFELILNVLALY